MAIKKRIAARVQRPCVWLSLWQNLAEWKRDHTTYYCNITRDHECRALLYQWQCSEGGTGGDSPPVAAPNREPAVRVRAPVGRQHRPNRPPVVAP